MIFGGVLIYQNMEVGIEDKDYFLIENRLRRSTSLILEMLGLGVIYQKMGRKTISLLNSFGIFFFFVKFPIFLPYFPY